MYAKNMVHKHRFLWDVLGGAGHDSKAATGTIPIFSAPAGCKINKVVANTIVAVTGSTAEEVGDGVDPDGYIKDGFAASIAVLPLSAEDALIGAYQQKTTAGATDAADVSNSWESKVYAAADTIDYVITGTATAGKIEFLVEFEQLDVA